MKKKGWVTEDWKTFTVFVLCGPLRKEEVSFGSLLEMNTWLQQQGLTHDDVEITFEQRRRFRID